MDMVFQSINIRIWVWKCIRGSYWRC